ncbi:P-loop containing nucleoside triphosphate hydrolase protein, partial [Mycena amicta]
MTASWGLKTGGDTLVLPIYIAGGSFVSLLLNLVWASTAVVKLRASYFKVSREQVAEAEPHFGGSIANHAERHGGGAIFLFKIARLVGCLLLLAFSSAAVVLDDDSEETIFAKSVFSLPSDQGQDSMSLMLAKMASPHLYTQLAMGAVYLYATVLAVTSLSARVKTSQIAARHLNTVLASTFLVYLYRDVFPLATYTLDPMDRWEGRLLWPKIFTLFVTSGIIPLVMPRTYVPLDPQNPMPVPNAEQTASILSSVFYFFMNPIVKLAYRIPHLPFDQLPPLCDYDTSKVLKARAFAHVDAFSSGKRRHVAFGLVWIFRKEFFIMAVLLAISGLANFVAPLSINRILDYLENPTAERLMKPWFWIVTLMAGPLCYSLTFQWDIFVGTHIMTQTASIITQLVFEHALRIRVKAETGQKPSDDKESKSSDKEASANLMGRINTLVTVDLLNINEARNILFLFVLVPIQVIGSIVFLYQVLGWSAFVGLASMVALAPLPGYAAKMISSIQKQALDRTDARVQTVTELLGVLRMIKMFGWEQQMKSKLEEKRKDELVWLWWRKVVFTMQATVNYLVPTITMVVTYGQRLPARQTVIMKQDLSASKVFSSMAVFDLLRGQIWFTVYCVGFVVRAKVSIDRLNDFLNKTELLDSFSQRESLPIVLDEPAEGIIGFRDASFTWSNDSPTDATTDGTATPSTRRFVLKIDGELFFKPGCFNLVVGPTGAGKTSLLMALLGEMHSVPTGPSSWYNLPRDQGVAFAAQESWVLNDTIKNNILFHSPLDTDRYRQTIHECCLERDLELFDAADETEVGEKGITLSGGQRARVTLARAIYSSSQIILLDDILAALDVHTARWIVEKCFRGSLVANRTVILVTHNIALTKKLADFVVSVGLDGRVHGEPSISAALAHDKVLAEEASKDEEILDKYDEKVDAADPANADDTEKLDGKLILEEEIEVGGVSWEAMKMFFEAHSSHPYLFFLGLLFFILLTEVLIRLETWFLGYWASQYGQGVTVPVFKYLGVFSGIVALSTTIYIVAYVYFTLGSFNASKAIHTKLMDSVFATTFRFLDVTPTSRFVARFTGDTGTIDDTLSEGFWDLIDTTVGLVTRLFAVVLFTPPFFGPGILVGFVGAWCGRIYMASQLSVKRELSNAKAPMLAHIGATIGGLASVRAYGAQETFVQISMERIDRLTRRIQRTFANLNRWVIVRIDTLGLLFAACLAYYLVYFQTHRPSNIGFTLSMAISFSGGILRWVQNWNQFEVQSNSIERVRQFIDVEQEAKPTPSGVPPAYWPASGNLSVQGLSARYSQTGPNILHDISFNIQSGERIGVVGRTGSGKSSLTLALLRCILAEGTVYYDGIATSSLNLDALRANITIIPQAPELLAGSLRSNIDILGQLDDAALNDALRAAGLMALQEDMEEGSAAKLTLDSEISGGGNNLSLGQRQIIALARAIVRGSKLLILDEGLGTLDYKTDNAIQTSLRTELPKDTTIITVAHRLQTIMDADKIMVLDAGKIIEFDSPKGLLQNHNGLLRALVEESGNKAELYAMA